MIRNKININVLIGIIFVIISFFAISSPSFSQEKTPGDDTIANYEKNRQAFQDRKKEIDQRSYQERSNIEKKIKTLEEDISGSREKLVQIKSLIAEKQLRITALKKVQDLISVFLFPIASAGAKFMPFFSVEKVLSIFVSLTLLNLFLYFIFRQKQLFTKYRIALIVFFVVLISAIAAPLFAEDNQTKRQKVITQLELATTVLSQSDHERFIAILESWESDKYIRLDPSRLVSGDPLLTVFPKVKLNTPEYYFTLAALYMHEGKTGKAIEAIEKIIDTYGFRNKQISNIIVINSTKFLIQQEQTELATKAVEYLAIKINDVAMLIKLAEYLQDNDMMTSNKKVLGYVVEMAETVEEFVELSAYLLNIGKEDKGADALERALSRVRNINELILVAKAVFNAGKDNLVEKIIKKTELISKFQSKIQVVDFFIEHGRKEEAILVFSEMIKSVKYNTRDKIKKLLFLIDAALERNFITQAIKATERLFMNLGKKKYDYQIEVGHQLKSAKNLPDLDKITLNQFYGMLNEELDYIDKAESQYIDNIINSLRDILQSYGYELPDSLNDFYLLGRIWKREKRGDAIEQLDRLYTIIENQFLKQYEIINDSNVKELRVNMEEKKATLKQLLAEIQKTKKYVNKINRKLIAQMVSIIGIITLLIAIIIGCLVISFEYAKKLSLHKTYGFVSKFFEMTGWVRVLSLLGIVSGLMSILITQFFQILQCTQENTLRLLNPDKAEKN